MGIRATLWDFGGVILESPFDAFARYEEANGLPPGLIRTLNATNPDTNAWARMERSEVSMEEFARLFEGEAAAAGHRVDARAVLALLRGRIRPEMVEAVRRCAARIPTGMVSNTFVGFGDDAPSERRPELEQIMGLFHVVIESSKVGLRKPDPRIYELACRRLGVDPEEVVFLDDLGINLKPARAMGMLTIKVLDPAAALCELEAAVGFQVRAPSVRG
ncbi:MAG TPA: HAD-IA family hydrolase [Acidimicrobiales bacterium]